MPWTHQEKTLLHCLDLLKKKKTTNLSVTMLPFHTTQQWPWNICNNCSVTAFFFFLFHDISAHTMVFYKHFLIFDFFVLLMWVCHSSTLTLRLILENSILVYWCTRIGTSVLYDKIEMQRTLNRADSVCKKALWSHCLCGDFRVRGCRFNHGKSVTLLIAVLYVILNFNRGRPWFFQPCRLRRSCRTCGERAIILLPIWPYTGIEKR